MLEKLWILSTSAFFLSDSLIFMLENIQGSSCRTSSLCSPSSTLGPPFPSFFLSRRVDLESLCEQIPLSFGFCLHLARGQEIGGRVEKGVGVFVHLGSCLWGPRGLAAALSGTPGVCLAGSPLHAAPSPSLRISPQTHSPCPTRTSPLTKLVGRAHSFLCSPFIKFSYANLTI